MDKYTPGQREEALRLYTEVGPKETSRRLGIPTRTIASWADKAGLVLQADREKTANARAFSAEQVSAEWGQFRAREATGAGATAARARRAVIEAMDAGKPGDAKTLAVVYGIMIDKAELLSGNATERIETWAQTEVDRELHQLVAEMEETIRAGNNGHAGNGHAE